MMRSNINMLTVLVTEQTEGDSSGRAAVRKGAWTREEDDLLRDCIRKYGEGKWHLVPSRAELNRCRKSCRLRWLNYLKPDIKRGEFTADEVDLILRLHKLLGNRWSLIAGRIPGRTANDVKNYWNTHLGKKVMTSYDKLKDVKKKDDGKFMVNSNIIKPRPRTFRNQLPLMNNSCTTTAIGNHNICSPPSPQDDYTHRQPGHVLENNNNNNNNNNKNSSWQSLLDMINSENQEFMNPISNTGFEEEYNMANFSELGAVSDQPSNLKIKGTTTNNSSVFVTDGYQNCSTDFVVDMDLWDLGISSEDKEMK